jgi:hypothetical protein
LFEAYNMRKGLASPFGIVFRPECLLSVFFPWRKINEGFLM